MHAWLQVVYPRANLNKVRLLPQTLVGRSPECHLRIATAQVSRRHCRFILQNDGVYVEDLSSANGTLLDGIRLPVLTPTYVRPEAVLEIGPARFVVHYSQEDTTTGLSFDSPKDVSGAAVPGPWLIGDSSQVDEGTVELPRPQQQPVLDPRKGQTQPTKASWWHKFFGKTPATAKEARSAVPAEPPPEFPAPVNDSVQVPAAPDDMGNSGSVSEKIPSDSSDAPGGDPSLQDFLNKLG